MTVRLWVISQQNVDGFCSNMGHFELLLEWQSVTVTLLPISEGVTVTADHCTMKLWRSSAPKIPELVKNMFDDCKSKEQIVQGDTSPANLGWVDFHFRWKYNKLWTIRMWRLHNIGNFLPLISLKFELYRWVITGCISKSRRNFKSNLRAIKLLQTVQISNTAAAVSKQILQTSGLLTHKC